LTILRPLAGIGDVKAEDMHAFFVQQPGVIDAYKKKWLR
jgi:hypothetical protein